MKVRAHTCYLGHTGFAAHARNFFRELSKHVDLRVRNYTWDSNPTYLDEIDFNIIDKITSNNIYKSMIQTFLFMVSIEPVTVDHSGKFDVRLSIKKP